MLRLPNIAIYVTKELWILWNAFAVLIQRSAMYESLIDIGTLYRNYVG